MDLKKRLIMFAVAAVTIITVTTTALAADSQPSGTGNANICLDLGQAQERFAALSDKQKSQVYKLYDDVAAQLSKLITQYEDYEVISDETASTLISHLTKATQRAKSEGHIIFGVLPPPPCPKGE